MPKPESLIHCLVRGMWPRGAIRRAPWRVGALLAGILVLTLSCGGKSLDVAGGARADQVFAMAEEGDSTAQTALGLLYERGIGVARDPALALVWYSRAAAQGDALAEFHIGSLYERGVGVARDYTEAAKWYQRASDKNNESAQAALAYLYDRGLGVERDFAEAEALYGQASRSWAEEDNYPAEATFATGREEGAALASPGVVAATLGGRRAEFVAGEAAAPAIEIDLDALNDLPAPPPAATIFDGPEPIARRGENFPLAGRPPAPPEPAHVPTADEPPGTVPMAAVDVADSLKPLPAQAKPRPPARVPPPENLPDVRLQSPEGDTTSQENVVENVVADVAEDAPEEGVEDMAEENLLIAAQPEPERTIVAVKELLEEEAAEMDAAPAPRSEEITPEPPAETAVPEAPPSPEAPVAEIPRVVAEDAIASLDAALEAEAAAFDAASAAAAETEEIFFPPLPPEPEIFLISLATFENEAAALEAWEKISTTHAGLLRNLPFELLPFDMGEDGGDGQFVELIVGPLDTPLKTRTLCGTLRAHGHVCRTIEK